MNYTFENNILNKKIWIYGIGVIGKRICNIFSSLKIHIEGIVVSSASSNIDSYNGIDVYEFSDICFNEDDLIIVAVNSSAQNEIVNSIVSKNVNYIVWTNKLLCDLWKQQPFRFENRVKGKKKLCLVLSGYKSYLWDDVYERLKRFAPEDIDICLCSAGKYVEELSSIARDNDWSYLSTSVNSVSQAQNICISLYSDVEWIYKMDEDMFITQNAFECLMDTAKNIYESKVYDLGLVSPLIPVNAIGYRYILEKYNKLEEYENIFGAAYVGGNPQREIEKNPEAAKYMWCYGGLPQLDRMANDIRNDNGYVICNTRLSIGFILFRRELWENMNGFTVHGKMDLGVDEEDINAYCINNSKIMAISFNSVVGHFGFGKQTNEMKEFYSNNKEVFCIGSAMKKVSIIMPSLNVKPYISECIDSVINQTLTDIEILCIDAGSTDGTLEILQQYARKDSRIKIIHSNVKSYGAQVNYGIKVAQGKYIAILETDDYVSLDMYEKLYDIAEREKVDYVKADFRRFYTLKNGNRLYDDVRLFDKKSYLYNKIINPNTEDDLYIYDCNLWKGIYSKDFLQKNNIVLNESYGAAYQDIGFMEQVLCWSRKAYYTDEIGYYYRTDRENASSYSVNALKNSWFEFNSLDSFINLNTDYVYFKGHYMHMVASFCAELKNTLRKVNFDYNKIKCDNYYKWFIEKIDNAFKQNIITISDFCEEIRKEISLLMYNLEGYLNYIASEHAKKEKQFEAIDAGSDIVIFGAGFFGRNILKQFDILDRYNQIVAFADNDTEKQGNIIGGKKIYGISECVRLYPNAIFLLANAKYSGEMKTQLLQNGINDNQIKIIIQI